MKKKWEGRFEKETDTLAETFLASIFFDVRLWSYDVKGSMAHAEMLGVCNILSKEESERIIEGLKVVEQKIQNDEVTYTAQDEDIHMWIERLLGEEIGPLAGKLHTARSRNDQVAVDVHLFIRDAIITIVEKLLRIQEVFIAQAKAHPSLLMPGYTHLQRAQPILWSHHLLSYCFMFQRDIERFQSSFVRSNCSPLGAGAMAGTTFPIDRMFTMKKLGFDEVYYNSLDAVSDRDFVVEFLSNASLVMMHLSRLCEELVLWSSSEFSFIRLDDAFCTGSSIMPQKRNPDCAELIRGKTGRVYGSLFSLLTLLKSLPLTYNKDMQEDKEPLFDCYDTLLPSLTLIAKMIETASPREEKLQQATKEGFLNATELADYLAAKGVPFREAHHVVGALVLLCEKEQKTLEDLPLSVYQAHHEKFSDDVYIHLSLSQAVARRTSLGGTAPAQVELQHQKLFSLMQNTRQWVQARTVGSAEKGYLE